MFHSADGELYSGTAADFMGRDFAIFRTLGNHHPIRTEQHDSRWLNGKQNTYYKTMLMWKHLDFRFGMSYTALLSKKETLKNAYLPIYSIDSHIMIELNLPENGDNCTPLCCSLTCFFLLFLECPQASMF